MDILPPPAIMALSISLAVFVLRVACYGLLNAFGVKGVNIKKSVTVDFARLGCDLTIVGIGMSASSLFRNDTLSSALVAGIPDNIHSFIFALIMYGVLFVVCFVTFLTIPNDSLKTPNDVWVQHKGKALFMLFIGCLSVLIATILLSPKP